MAHNRNIGVALSGGGVRAAAFALGGLLYLVDSGLNQRVGAISSVSGGSITNAILMRCGFDFSKADRTEFDTLARKFIFLLTRRPIMGWLVFALYFVLIALGVLAVFLLAGWPIVLAPWPRVVVLVVWGFLFLFRGWPIEIWMHWKYFARSTLRDPTGSPKRTIAHVFCTTELGESAPFFFLAEGVAYSPSYGLGRADHIRLATAVRASAALPGAFPPRLVPSKAMRFIRTILSREKPPWALFLADGGIWNNLGTQWFEGGGPSSLSHTSIPSGHEVRHLIVLNASSPLRGMPKSRRLAFILPLFAEFIGFGRVVATLYANTIEPRILEANAWLAGALHRGTSESALVMAVANIYAPGPLRDMQRACGWLLSSRVTQYFDREERMDIANRVALNPRLLGDENTLREFSRLVVTEESLTDTRKREQALKDLIEKLESACTVEGEALSAKIMAAMPPNGLREFCSSISTKLTRLKEDEVVALVVHGYLQTMEAAVALSFLDEGPKAEVLVTIPDSARFTELLPRRVPNICNRVRALCHSFLSEARARIQRGR